MVDNVQAGAAVGVGDKFAVDKDGTQDWPLTKVVWGTLHSAYNIVDIATALPVQPGTGATWAVTGTFWQTTQPISAASLPLPTGASTAAKQPALGTAGTASADVLTVQGIAGMTAVKVDGSAVTQPVSGTFWQATQPVSAASLPLPTGAATAAKQPALGTAGAASADVITVQGIASMTALKVDGSGVTQPVSGTVTTTPPSNASTNVAQFGGSNAVTGTGASGAGIPRVTVSNDSSLQPIPATSGGLSISRVLSAASTNATSVKASAGQVYSIYAHNTNASPRFLKLYNKASAPTVGTDTPVLTLPIPGNASGAGFVLDTGGMGIAFATGIALAITGAVTDADTTAVALNEVVVNLLYK